MIIIKAYDQDLGLKVDEKFRKEHVCPQNYREFLNLKEGGVCEFHKQINSSSDNTTTIFSIQLVEKGSEGEDSVYRIQKLTLAPVGDNKAKVDTKLFKGGKKEAYVELMELYKTSEPSYDPSDYYPSVDLIEEDVVEALIEYYESTNHFYKESRKDQLESERINMAELFDFVLDDELISDRYNILNLNSEEGSATLKSKESNITLKVSLKDGIYEIVLSDDNKEEYVSLDTYEYHEVVVHDLYELSKPVSEFSSYAKNKVSLGA